MSSSHAVTRTGAVLLEHCAGPTCCAMQLQLDLTSLVDRRIGNFLKKLTEISPGSLHPGNVRGGRIDLGDAAEANEALFFRLCPRCGRAVPARSNERYCANDGAPLLEVCPVCRAHITNPYARHCARCGSEFA